MSYFWTKKDSIGELLNEIDREFLESLNENNKWPGIGWLLSALIIIIMMFIGGSISTLFIIVRNHDINNITKIKHSIPIPKFEPEFGIGDLVKLRGKNKNVYDTEYGIVVGLHGYADLSIWENETLLDKYSESQIMNDYHGEDWWYIIKEPMNTSINNRIYCRQKNMVIVRKFDWGILKGESK